ncbi:MAG: D-glycero-beta-D-manno-heptose 1-phosphate adenylyltransferase [Bacillota bacterium]
MSNKSFVEKKFKSRKELVKITDEAQNRDNRVVFTNGCFDIIHVGHVRYLYQASQMGEILIVGVNSDSSVRQLKGAKRPIVPEEERVEVLSALQMIDYIFLFEELTCKKPLREIKPDIYVKGGDYSRKTLPEWSVVENYGGRVEFVREIRGSSTTSLLQRIRSEVNEGRQ